MTYTESLKSGHIAVWSPDTFKMKPEELNSTFDKRIFISQSDFIAVHKDSAKKAARAIEKMIDSARDL